VWKNDPAKRRSEKPKRAGSKEEPWSTPEAERLGAEAERPEVEAEKPAVAKKSQAEYGASVRQDARRLRTWTSGPWRRRYRDPEEVGQGAEPEEPSEEETVDCMEDQMKILRNKNENQREERLCQAQNAAGRPADCYQGWAEAKSGHDGVVCDKQVQRA
jgi:hypothetical protein